MRAVRAATAFWRSARGLSSAARATSSVEEVTAAPSVGAGTDLAAALGAVFAADLRAGAFEAPDFVGAALLAEAAFVVAAKPFAFAYALRISGLKRPRSATLRPSPCAQARIVAVEGAEVGMTSFYLTPAFPGSPTSERPPQVSDKNSPGSVPARPSRARGRCLLDCSGSRRNADRLHRTARTSATAAKGVECAAWRSRLLSCQ